MNRNRGFALAAVLLASLAMLGCRKFESLDASSLAAKAGNKINEQNLSIGGHDLGSPEAELTPQGDLLIGGNKVAVTVEQHALLVRHRELLEQVARDGVEVGLQGAAIATHAVGEAVTGIFDGDKARAKANIEAQAGKVKESARRLCDRLPALYESQQAVAAAVPEFRPYAKMTPDDAKHCHAD